MGTTLIGRVLSAGLTCALALAACADGGTTDPADADVAVDAAGVDAAGVDAAPGIDATPPPYGVAMFVRGSWTGDFSARDELVFDGATYQVTINLTAAGHTFKVSDAQFSDQRTFSASATMQQEVLLDTPTTLEIAVGLGNDSLLSAPMAGDYTFTLAVGSDVNAPTLTISRAP